MKKTYVAGFMFSPDLENVVLIEKQKPEWQKGKYNAVGGKIEDGETPQHKRWLESLKRKQVF